MDFLKNWFLPKSKKEATYGGSWTTIYPAEAVERNLLNNNKEWVFLATEKIAKAVESVRFKVMRYQRNGDDQEVFNGPLVDFLESPASQYTGKDFIYLTTAWKELTGNAFWEIGPGRKLIPLIPTSMKPRMSGGQLVGFTYYEGATKREIPLDKVLHDRYIDPSKPWWGVGKLEKIARWVDTASYANEFLRLFFINGAQFGGFITTEEESEERIKLIKLGLLDEHAGVQNSHKIAVLPKGSEFQAATANMADMQFGELDDRYRDKILSGFGVPKTLVGFTTEVNRASAEASEYIFAKYTVKPIVDDFVEFLNVKVAPLFDATGKFYFAYDDFVPENMEVKLKERELALNKQPYRTVNEVRAEVGLPPIEGGDVVYGNPMQVPLGTPAPAPVIPDAPQDPQKDPKEPQKALPRRARAAFGVERMVEEIVGKAVEVASDRQTLDAESHKRFVSRVTEHEERVAEKVKQFNGRQKHEVMERLARITKAVSKSELFDMDAEVGILVDFVGPLLRGLLTEQAIEEYKAQGFEGAFNTEGSNIARIVELAAKRLAKSYNDTTANLLKAKLNEGIANGESLSELADRVSQIYEFSDQYRAKQVAQTESFYIANEGSREAYRQSGVVKTVRWYTAEDERVCEFCGPEDGRIVSIDDDFYGKGETITGRDGGSLSLDYRTIDVPPLHPSCRCFIRPEEIVVKSVELLAV